MLQYNENIIDDELKKTNADFIFAWQQRDQQRKKEWSNIINS
jgi:hypothetical protein